jgi:DNA-binding transcriptional regulator YdaS (Cro superfamily)
MQEKTSATKNPGLAAAVKTAGGVRSLGRALNIAHSSILTWKQIPARHILQIEKLTGIPRERLRPDLYR